QGLLAGVFAGGPARPRRRNRRLSRLLACRRRFAARGRLDPQEPLAAGEFPQGVLNPRHTGRPLAELTRLIVSGWEANYQGVWPENCWAAGLVQFARQQNPYGLKSLRPDSR